MNRLLLRAQVVEHGPMRWTPAGIAALDLLLEHEGQAEEAGQARRVQMRLKAVAFGDVVDALKRLGLGRPALFAGFLAASGRAPRGDGPSRGLTFHVASLQPQAPDAAADPAAR